MRTEDLHLLINEELYILKEHVATERPTKKEIDLADPKIPIAFIHTSKDKGEQDLLGKIIEACKLDPSQYKVLKPEDEIAYDKAIIFSDAADSYYQPLVSNNIQKLYSRSLGFLIQSKEDKAKLWEALKLFI